MSNPAQSISFTIQMNSGPAVVATQKVIDTFKVLDAFANRLAGSLVAVNNRLSNVLTGFVNGANVGAAIGVAKAAEQSTARLQSAVGTQTAQLEKLKAIQNDVASRTTLSQTAVRNLEADLLDRGVSLAKVSDAVEATVQTSAALHISLQQAGEQIAETFGGHIPDALAHAVPALKNLTDAQLRSGAAADLLQKRFRGAAEALSATDAGKAQRGANALHDVYEAVGKILLRLETVILPPLAAAFQRLESSLETPGAQKFLGIVGQIGAALAGQADIIIPLAGSYRLLGAAMGAIGLEKMFARWIALPAAITAAGAALGVFISYKSGLLEGVNTLGDLRRMFGDIADRIRDGSLRFSDFVSQLKIDAVAYFEYFKLYFLELPAKGLEAFIAFASSQFDTLGARLQVAGLRAAGAFSESAKQAAEVLNDVLNQKALKEAAQAGGVISGGVVDRIAEIEKTRDAARLALQRDVSDVVAKADNDAALKRGAAHKAADDQLRADAIAQRKELYDQLTALDAAGQQKTDDIWKTGALGRVESEKLATAELDKQYAARLISLTQYVDAKRNLQTKDAQADLAALQKHLTDVQASEVKNLATTGADRQGADEAELNRLLLDERDTRLQILRVRVQLKSIGETSDAETITEARQREQQAQGELSQTIQRNAGLVEAGMVSSTEATDQSRAAFEKFRREVSDVQAALQSLAAQTDDPAVRERAQQLIAQNQANLTIAASQIKGTAEYYARSIRSGLEEPLQGFFKDLLDNIGNAQQAFSKFLQSIASKMLDFVASEAANKFLDIFSGRQSAGGGGGGGIIGSLGQLLSGLFGGGSGGLGTIANNPNFASDYAIATGGFNAGGMVGKPIGPDRDSVRINATLGEFIMTRRAVQLIGPEKLQRINRMAAGLPDRLPTLSDFMPKGGYNLGGLIASHAGHPASKTQIIFAPIPTDNVHAKRVMDGGKNAVLSFLGNHKTEVKAVLDL